jgi:hypothetical protein
MHPLGGVNACLRTVQLPSMPAATLVCPCLLRLSAQHRRFACSDGGRNKGQAIVPFRISFAGYHIHDLWPGTEFLPPESRMETCACLTCFYRM